jgi:hypothetical protein
MDNDFIFILCSVFFLLGVLGGGWYASFFNKRLKKNGYLVYELTDKFHKEMKTGKYKENG